VTSPTPATPPTSAAAVARQLQWPEADIADPVKLARLEVTVAAVNEFVAHAATTGPDSRALGAAMLGARLWRRRASAEGTATYTADQAVGAARSDPEVWMLLGLGSWAPPVVG
jgi:uncharacterized protein (DUF2342 family)